MKPNNLLITICARGGSKGLPGKHMLDLHGKPLIQWTMEQALEFKEMCGPETYLVVSSDDEAVLELAIDMKIFCLRRHPDLCGDGVGKVEVFRHLAEYFPKIDTLIDLDATNPLRTMEDIEEAYRVRVKRNSVVLSCVEARKNPHFNQAVGTVGGFRLPCESTTFDESVVSRQSAPEIYDLNASISVLPDYFTNGVFVAVTDTIFLLHEMPDYAAFDIDTQLDFEIVRDVMFPKWRDANA